MKDRSTTQRGPSAHVSSKTLWRRLASLATCALLWMLGSCKPPPPQIMLRIETDIPQGPNGILNAVHVRLLSPETGQAFFDRSIVLDEATKLPGDVAISWDGRFPLLDARVSAMQRVPGTTPPRYERLFEVRAVATFPENDAVTLWVYLANRCLLAENRNCPRGFTCGRYGCEPETRGELRPTREDAGPPEATVVSALDASMDVRDASLDAGDGSMDVPMDGPRCRAFEMLCDGVCVNVSTNTDHCGRCGQRCPMGDGVTAVVCERGMCRIDECRPGRGDCDNDPRTGCEANLESSSHCGACGRSCPDSMPICSTTSGCVARCELGESQCGMSCVDTQTNWQHCGDCNRACPVYPNSTPECSGGRCMMRCLDGFADCDGVSMNGCEVELPTNVEHCGRCGVRCTVPASFNARPVCRMGACAFECLPGFADCDGDPRNGCEVDLSSSLDHCGACGARCVAGANQSATCMMGRCVIQCRPGFADCNGMMADGCEASLSNPGTCGSCTNACVGTMPVCSEGMCSMTCGPSQTLCSGSCVSTGHNSEHCGACGNACPTVPNATPRCESGMCSFACNSGFADCDMQRNTGCEVFTPSSPLHCGRCRNACPSPMNATPTCNLGVCGFVCFMGYGDCNTMADDGCETSLNYTVDHCGACGRRCPSGPRSTPVCSAGTCRIQCDEGWIDANEIPHDGCELCRNEGRDCDGPGDGDLFCRQHRIVCDPMTGRMSCVPAAPIIPIREGLACGTNLFCRGGWCLPPLTDGGDVHDGSFFDARDSGVDTGVDIGMDSGLEMSEDVRVLDGPIMR